MEITKGKLKQIIKEEMHALAETGDISMITDSERAAFEIILKKLSTADLKKYGLQKK